MNLSKRGKIGFSSNGEVYLLTKGLLMDDPFPFLTPSSIERLTLKVAARKAVQLT